MSTRRARVHGAVLGCVALATATAVAVATAPDAPAPARIGAASLTADTVAVGEPLAVAPPVDDATAVPAGPLAAVPTPGPTGPNGVEGSLGIPTTLLAAYHRAEATLAAEAPTCGIRWWLLAGVGRVETRHAAGGAVAPDGTTLSPIRGPRLDGTRFVAIPDTDGGLWDDDAVWDRAVGPMQFIPGTWKAFAADGNADGIASPDNAFDATLAAARYLCRTGADLTTVDGRRSALLRYNRSERYGALVLQWADAYAAGASEIPDSTLVAAPREIDTGLAVAGGGLVDDAGVPAEVAAPAETTVPSSVVPTTTAATTTTTTATTAATAPAAPASPTSTMAPSTTVAPTSTTSSEAVCVTSGPVVTPSLSPTSSPTPTMTSSPSSGVAVVALAATPVVCP